MVFPLSYGEKSVGSVFVTKRGLYYDIKCRFNQRTGGMFRLIAVSDNKEIDLGICIPYDQQLGVDMCIPIKTVGKQLCKFYITSCDETLKGICISSDKPFDHIAQLEDAVLCVKGNDKKIFFVKQYDHSA